jgi:hypothetical protein
VDCAVNAVRSKRPAGWATLIAPAGVHAVLFAPRTDRGGPRAVVGLLIPEGETMIDRALAEARRGRRLVVLCDSRQQADEIAGIVTRALSGHRRVPLSAAAAGGWGLSS